MQIVQPILGTAQPEQIERLHAALEVLWSIADNPPIAPPSEAKRTAFDKEKKGTVYGPVTKELVTEFQTIKKIEALGILDGATAESMNDMLAEQGRGWHSRGRRRLGPWSGVHSINRTSRFRRRCSRSTCPYSRRCNRNNRCAFRSTLMIWSYHANARSQLIGAFLDTTITDIRIRK